MKVSLRWLQEYVDLPTADPQEIARAFDMLGHAVDEVTILDVEWKSVVIGKVLSVDAHPNADNVRVTSVSVGEENPYQIICGAWNFDAGATVAVALPGAVLPGGFQIGSREIRGVKSHGMICSERELGLGEDQDGIMVLAADAPVGQPFESTLEFEPTRFDRYVDAPAEGGLLNDSEIAGLRLFIDPKNQCLKCHNGPMFTNGGFHNIGTGSPDPASLDVGRIAGLQSAILDEFNCRGRYSDDRERCSELEHLAPDAHLAGAFKVPSIRGAAKTPPYMHDGRFSTLREVLEFYRTPPARSNAMPHELVPLPHLTDSDLDSLEALLRMLGE